MEEIQDFFQANIIGGARTLVAMKSPDSFLMATFDKGLILIEDEDQLYSGRLPGKRSLQGISYISLIHCYFLVVDDKILRKDINKRPPYLFVQIK